MVQWVGVTPSLKDGITVFRVLVRDLSGRMAQPQDHLSPWPPFIRQPSHIPTFNSSPVTSPQVPEQRHRSQKAKEVVVVRPAESEEELKSIMASGPITSWEIDGETVSDFIFLGSKITADGDCSHEIKRRLLLGRKVMTNLDSIFKSRDITLPRRVCLVKAMVFPVAMYGCES
uniref:Uncharacterized protein n=1 Tax=Ovis aries TaxID=9940 RepID=A0AC11ERQ6_SHEEP